MPVTVDELKEFAQQRDASETSEIELRAAVSRAYYALFHRVLPFAELLPRSRKCPRRATHVSHEELTERLHEWDTASVDPCLARLTALRNQLVNTIEVARTLRVKADYRLPETCSQAELKQQLIRVGKVTQAMQQIEAELQRSRAS